MTRTRSFHNHHHHLFFLVLLIHSLMFKFRWHHGGPLTRRTGHVEAYSINHGLRHTLQSSSLTGSTASATCGSRSIRSLPVLAIDFDRRHAAFQFSTTTTLKSSLSSSTSTNHESSPTIIPLPVVPVGIPRKFVAYPFQVRLFLLGGYLAVFCGLQESTNLTQSLQPCFLVGAGLFLVSSRVDNSNRFSHQHGLGYWTSSN